MRIFLGLVKLGRTRLRALAGAGKDNGFGYAVDGGQQFGVQSLPCERADAIYHGWLFLLLRPDQRAVFGRFGIKGDNSHRPKPLNAFKSWLRVFYFDKNQVEVGGWHRAGLSNSIPILAQTGPQRFTTKNFWSLA